MLEACQNFVEVLKIYVDFAKILRVYGAGSIWIWIQHVREW
jgi:hypothetical protein